jgi:ubiquinone biosynthesis protein COQ4
MSVGALLRDGFRIGQSTVRVLRDSGKTREIHRVGEITGQARFRQILAELAGTAEGRRLLAERPELNSEHVDFARLRRLPRGSLGAAYVGHLDGYSLTANAEDTATTLVDDPDIAYLMRRGRQAHDVWHALLGLGITGHEEVLVHCFTYGQLRLPVSAMIICFGSIKHFVLEQRWAALRHSTLEAYRIGRAAAPLLPVIWEDLWEQPLERVRATYGVRPLDRAPFAETTN